MRLFSQLSVLLPGHEFDLGELKRNVDPNPKPSCQDVEASATRGQAGGQILGKACWLRINGVLHAPWRWFDKGS